MSASSSWPRSITVLAARSSRNTCLRCFFFGVRKGDEIYQQLRKLGASLDWSRACFTMDEVRLNCTKQNRLDDLIVSYYSFHLSPLFQTFFFCVCVVAMWRSVFVHERDSGWCSLFSNVSGFQQGCDGGLCAPVRRRSDLSLRGSRQLELCAGVRHLGHRGDQKSIPFGVQRLLRGCERWKRFEYCSQLLCSCAIKLGNRLHLELRAKKIFLVPRARPWIYDTSSCCIMERKSVHLKATR